VAHLPDGALRRLYDEPFAQVERDRAHFNSCALCQERFKAVAEEARRAAVVLAVPTVTTDAGAALAGLKARADAGATERAPLLERLRGHLSSPRSTGGWSWRKPALAGVVAAGLAATMAFTPAVQTIRNIFEPAQLTPTAVTFTPSDAAGLQAFSRWGDVTGTYTPQLTEVSSAHEAARVSNLHEIHLDQSKLPGQLANAPVGYGAMNEAATGSVTFNNNAPANLRGTTLDVQVGPAEAAVYGDLAQAITNARHAAQSASPAGADQNSTGDTGSAASAERSAAQHLNLGGPLLAVAEVRAPKVTSHGASLATIKSTLLKQPGLTASVKNLIEQIDSPAGNLPIPIPADLFSSSTRTLDNGAKATVVGDNTGLGAGVVWIKGGIVYAVAGTVSLDDAVKIANSIS
jgi:hypothetical protein